MIHCTYVIISACFRQHLDLSSSSPAKLCIVSKCSNLPRIMGTPSKNEFKCMFHSPIEALSKDAISSGMVPSSPTEQIMVCLFRIQIISNVSAHANGSLRVPFSVHFLFTFCKFHERLMQICSFTNFLYKYICRSCLLALPKIDVRLHLTTDTPNEFINNHRERFMRKPVIH